MTLEVLKNLHENGTEPVPPKLRDICLLGYAEETRDLVHSLPEDTEIWGINMANVFLHRPAHYWFQLHPRNWASTGGDPTGYFGRPKEHLEFLQKFPGTVWLADVDPDIPNGKPYPIDEVAISAGREYLTSTFAYQLALALYEHTHGKPIKRFYMYGVNLTALEEYAGQRPCAEYWIGRCEQAGIEVNLPNASALLKGPLYPRRGNDLQEHAQERLQHWKGRYMTAAFNANTAMSMQTELKHWSQFLSKIAVAHPEQFNPDIKKEIQDHFGKRWDTLDEMAICYLADLNGAMGVVKDSQHWLTILGGTDFKAPALPEFRAPQAKLAEDFELPSETRRI